MSWIEVSAGPKATVFRDDGAYAAKLKKLSPAEADRRLQLKLQKSVTRFELSDRLRASTAAKLPREQPWVNTVSAAAVATVLESFLVEEVPATSPDPHELRPLGVDAVVELVIESYGMRSRGGHAGAYVRGHGRMFFLDGGEIWRRPFFVDGIDVKRPHLDPFRVAKMPDLFRTEMAALIEQAAEQLGQELNLPARRKEKQSLPETGSDELSAPPDDTNKTGKENRVEDDELPAPDELPSGT